MTIYKMPFEFSVKVRSLPAKGRFFTFSADAEVAQRIAVENDLLEVKEFVATAHVSPWKGGGVTISGKVRAALIQACAASLDPLKTSVDEKIEIIFLPDDSTLAKPARNNDREWVFDPEGDDLPDTFAGDTIDLAKPWLEAFVLGLDLFARIEGAELSPKEAGGSTESPFSVLAALKPN